MTDKFLKINYKYKLSRNRIEAEQYPEFHAFLKAVQEKERQEVRLIRFQPNGQF